MSANAITASPTGRKKLAQGKEHGGRAQAPALGHDSPDTSSPEGAKERGELPKGWRWVTLRGIADIAGGVTKGQKRRPNESIRRIPYLRVANVQRGYLDLTEMKEIDASVTEIESLRLQPGDILFNEGGDRDKLGRGWIWNGELSECVHQNHVFRARVRDSSNNPKFISYYGNSAGQKYFYDQGKHTTNLASINLTKLGALPIPLPPPDEQQRIVAEIEKQFTRLEAGVAALRRVQANLKRYRAAVLKAACEGRLVPTEAELQKSEVRGQKSKKKFETGAELLARILTERRQNWQGRGKYKEPAPPDTTNLPSLPEGWTWATVEQLCSLVTDGDHNPPKRHESGVAHLTAKNVRNWRLDATDCTFISATDAERVLKRYNPVAGDLIVTCVGTVGRTAIVPPGFKFSPDRNLAAVRLVDGGASTRYLNFTLSSPGHQELIRGASGSTAQPHLYLGDLRAIAIPLPPLAEQTRIVAEVERRLSVVEELESVVSANLQRATRLRQSILQKAFSGGLVSSEPSG